MKPFPEVHDEIDAELFLADQKRRAITRKMVEIRILEIEIDHHKLRARALRKEKANGKR